MISLRRALPPLAAAALLFVTGACSQEEPGPSRIVLPDPKPVQEFSLTDQNGNPVSAADFLGKPTVVTFLYTACSDTCPYEALKLGRVYDLLGDRADEVNLVAISTDPDRDTIEAIKTYTDGLNLTGKWRFLTGDKATLEAVWKDFGVAVAFQSEEEIAETQRSINELGLDTSNRHEPAISPIAGLTQQELSLASEIITAFGGGYEVSHTVPFWYVDAAGNRRVALGPASTPEQLLKELETYL